MRRPGLMASDLFLSRGLPAEPVVAYAPARRSKNIVMVPVVVSPTTIRRSFLGLAVLFVAAAASAILTRAQPAPSATNSVPGALTDGTTLLPNGWRLSPAGRHVKTGSLPLNLIVSPD